MIERPSLLCVDPPWLWSARSTKGEDRAPKYQRMTIADIGALPIRDVIAENAVVFLWVIDPMLPHAMQVVREWGLTFKTVGFYWTKTKPSGALHMGGGYYTRANPEQCWLLTKGKGLPRVSRSVQRWVTAPVGRHSEKPAVIYRNMETLFGNVPRMELFARERRDGWRVVGNEIDGRDIMDALRDHCHGNGI